MLLSKIAQVLGFDGIIKADREIGWLLTDSRSLSFPTESLFFALVSSRNNGHQYIDELYSQGVKCFIVSEIRPDYDLMQDAVFLLVDDALSALQQVATFHRHQFQMPVIGITGSNGKTIVKEWLFQLLHADFKIVRSPRSYNSQIGVPLSVWQMKTDTQLGIFEAGISQPDEMALLAPIISPTIGIFTNIGDAHQEYFVSREQKIREKLLLFQDSAYIVFCSDQLLVYEAIRNAGLKAKLLHWGKSEHAWIRLTGINKEANQTEISICVQNVIYTFCIPFTDDASIENIMHCITLMHHWNYSRDEIKLRVALLESVAMRLEVKQGLHDCLIINDSYNSDLNSLGIALDFLIQQAASKNLSKTIILSDILQSGLQPQVLYQKVAKLVHAKKINKIIGIGEDIAKYHQVFSDIEHHFFNSTTDFLKSQQLDDLQQEAILLKGSRKFEFELISHKLELIAHETVLEVSLTNLIENLNYFRSKLCPETKVMCMVKAFAYGSGSVEIAKTLQHHRADYLAVAVADEGAELRRSGIRIPIAVMNPEKSAFSLLFENNLEPEIYSFKLLSDFIEAAGKLAITAYPIHIKIDTGMHRLGFDPDEIDRLIEVLKNQNQLKVRSVFSHLAGADDQTLDGFTNQQAAIYTACADKFSQAFEHKMLRHILNSAGTERFPEHQFDMVRLGIGHYGVSALPNVHLKQVCTLKTIVLQIKNVKAGETVGYNRKGIVDQDKQIAVLPVGYADGFNRKLGNGVGEVVIQGKRAPVFGNVSMDLIAVDVTGLQVSEGDVVEVFGDTITISELASKLNTIPYEILTGISRRVKRIYFQE